MFCLQVNYIRGNIMDIRERNAQYDADIGNIYDKCVWCFKVIIGPKFEIHQDGVHYLCSQHCKSIMLYALRYHTARNRKVDEDSYMYDLLQKEVTKNYERIKERRGY